MKPYKGYVGVARVDTDAGVIRGEVVNTRDTITFQGTTVPEAERAFHDSVDDYLEFCAEQGTTPDRPFSGKFPVRTTPSVHRDLVIAASRKGVSLNMYVSEALARAARSSRGKTHAKPGPTAAKSRD